MHGGGYHMLEQNCMVQEMMFRGKENTAYSAIFIFHVS